MHTRIYLNLEELTMDATNFDADADKFEKLTKGMTESQKEEIASVWHESGEMAAEQLAQKYKHLM